MPAGETLQNGSTCVHKCAAVGHCCNGEEKMCMMGCEIGSRSLDGNVPTWLRAADLTGAQIKFALLHLNEVDTVDKLLNLYAKNNDNFRNAFPQAVVRSKVTRAMKATGSSVRRPLMTCRRHCDLAQRRGCLYTLGEGIRTLK